VAAIHLCLLGLACASVTQVNTKPQDRTVTFCEALVSELLKDPVPKAFKQVYITKNTVLPKIQLTQPIGIYCPIPSKQQVCLFCCWSCQTKKGCSTKVITKSNCIPKTCLICSYCNTPLCRECFIPFYYFIA
jgi:hypothetical protein